MKHFWMFSPFSLLLVIISLGQISPELPDPNTDVRISPSPDSSIQYTAKVKAIIDAKCYDCHNEKGEDEEAKEELMWDKLNQLSKMDQMFSMDAIIESVEEGEMPPEDHVKEHPEAALSKEEAKILIEWADAIATKLLD